MSVSELRELGAADLHKRLQEARQELFSLRLQRASGKLLNPGAIWNQGPPSYPQQHIQNPAGGGNVPGGDLLFYDEPKTALAAADIDGSAWASFALYLVNVDGSGLERVTWADGFASFPMFTRDGKRLVFCGSRGASTPRGLDVFTADWESF